MYADFLILLVSRTNGVILDDSRCRWFQVALLYKKLRNVAPSEDQEKVVNQWTVLVREFAVIRFFPVCASLGTFTKVPEAII